MSNTTKNNLDIIPSKNDLGTSKNVNNNKNNKYSIRKQNRKNIEIFDKSNNNSYFNNINLIYNNSSNDINKITDINLISQKTNLNSNIKLKNDINNIGLNSPKEANIKLIFSHKNNNSGKNSNRDLPIALINLLFIETMFKLLLMHGQLIISKPFQI